MKLKLSFFLLISLLQIPVYADFGSHFIVNSRMASPLNTGEKKLSFRFTCQQDMTLIAVSLYCEESQTPPSYKISLCHDENGKPAQEILSSSYIVPLGKSWLTVPLDGVSLYAGKVYHLVVEQDKNRGGEHPVGIIGPKNFASFSYTDFPNQIIPTNESPDPKSEVLLFKNGGWHPLHRQPLYALHGTGHQAQGNPYDTFEALPIHGYGTPNGGLLQGEALHPHCKIVPTGFAIRVRKQGHPTAPLNFKVYANEYLHHITRFSYGGIALKPEQVSDSFQWVTIGFGPLSQPFETECTYVGFQTDSGQATTTSPGCEDCYLISGVGNSGNLPMAAEMTFDGGPHLSRAAYSMDGGATWIDRFEWDANIVLLGPACPPTTEPSIDPIPTPEPLPDGLNP